MVSNNITSAAKTPATSSAPAQAPTPKNEFFYRSSRWPGRLLMLTGVLHTCYSFRKSQYRDPFFSALRNGYFNQFAHDPARGNSFWFLMAGCSLALMGELMNWYLFPEPRNTISEKREKHVSSSVGQTRQKNQEVSKFALPRKLGVWLVGMAIGGVIAFPTSGFYLIGFQGLAILLTE